MATATIAPASTKAHRLRARLHDRTRPVVAAGAHDALSAKLIEEAGFDAVWVSSFGLSTAQKCQPDANVLTMTEALDVAKNVEAAVGIPVIADCDTGYGDAINVMRTTVEFERAGIAAIAIEDNLFPKRCSLYPGARPDIATLEEMVGRVKAAKHAQRTPDFAVIARTEALIAGLGIEEAERRAHAYAEAGADAILVHSKAGAADEALAFAARWRRPIPLVVVPTMFPQATVAELHQAGFQLIIFANHALRAAIRAMAETLRTLQARGTADAVTDTIAPLAEVYRLVGLDQLHAREQQFIPQPVTKARAIILAAGVDQQLLPLTEDRPKTMLDIKGRTILERQAQLLRAAGITDIAVVRGYRAEAVTLPGITYYDNPHFQTRGIAASLFAAAERLTGPTLVLYGDIVFDRMILDRLLDRPGDLTLVVDRAWYDVYRTEGRSPERAELVITREAPTGSHRFLPSERPATVLQIGQRLDKRAASGEFIGLCACSADGARWLTERYQAGAAQPDHQPFHEAETFARASFTDLLQAAIERGHPVQAVEIYKGWLEVNTFDDYRRAWAKL
ncbi:MAG: isocitrate lyase/phosphoenolpyruvate mutase family protein [Candidatus Omnitrophica bacterium]|nr:isocitrate lyase/phosphoenolpyruvate mutase family protein [Candidatus Omnitrophota bacterium]